jgi:triosephosphate isomerase
VSRRPFIAGNWKMHKTTGEARALASAIVAGLASEGIDVLVAPPYTALTTVADALRGSRVALGAQDVHWERQGAYTGAISVPMLKDAGCTHVIVGHSERRELFGETDEAVARKTRAAIDGGLVPIVCVGETLVEREQARTMEVVEREVERALRALSPAEASAIVLAYEPMWAIGTGCAATPEQAQEVHRAIRRFVARSHGDDVSSALRILYGGSVKPDNMRSLMAQPDVDGALVGGACLEAASFLGIVQASGAA